MAIAILSVSALFFIGHALKWVFNKTKIPDLLILVLVGYVLGQLGVVQAADFGKVGAVVATLALIVILYEGGLSLRAKDLASTSLPALGLAVAGFFSIAIVAAIFAAAFALQPWQNAILLGLGVGSTSSAVVIPMVRFLSVTDRTKTILSLESAFTDVLAIVLFLVIVDGIVANQFSVSEIFMGIGPKALIAITLGLVLGLGWALLRRLFPFLVETRFMNEAWAALSYGLIEVIGYNGALGVLALGFMLSNIELLPQKLRSHFTDAVISKDELSLLNEIAFLLKTFFFIYLGLLVKFSDWKTVSIALAVSAMIFVTRLLVIRFIFKPSQYPRLDAMIAVAMGPRGLACAVLATIPVQRGIAEAQWLQDTIFAIIPISIVLTSLFVVMSENDGLRKKLETLFKAYPQQLTPPAEPSPIPNAQAGDAS